MDAGTLRKRRAQKQNTNITIVVRKDADLEKVVRTISATVKKVDRFSNVSITVNGEAELERTTPSDTKSSAKKTAKKAAKKVPTKKAKNTADEDLGLLD
jgi:hypothetical protein